MINDRDKHLMTFINKYQNNREEIFNEIYEYLGNKTFKSLIEFKLNYIKILTKEENNSKKLSSGLILKIGYSSSALELTDDNSTFRIGIQYMKKVKIKRLEGISEQFIISEKYYNKVIRDNNCIKYKLKNSSKESSLESNELEIKVIFNESIEYLSVIPDYKDIYKKVFEIFEKEKNKSIIEPKEFFNEFRILNFPEFKNYDLDKIKWKINYIYYDYNNKYFCYNKKVGLSLFLQRNLIDLTKENIKYFYLNIDYLINESSIKNIRKYIFFYLSTLFFTNEYKEYIEFIEKEVLSIINYKGKTLIIKLLEILQKNIKNMELYIDNIKTKMEFDIIDDFIKTYDANINIFIQINNNTLPTLCNINFKLITYEPDSFSISDDMEYHLPLKLDAISLTVIKNTYSEQLKSYFSNFDYEDYRFLLKIKLFLNSTNFDLIELKKYASFLDFLLIKIHNKRVNKINFRNNMIKEIFDDLYEGYITKMKNINSNIFSEISKSEEGIYFEKQIIFDLITNKVNIQKVKIDKIFSIKEFPDFKKIEKQGILFIQTNTNAPYYDFSYIYTFNNLNILKCCQIGINKNIRELEKLNKMFLLFDLYFFCQKLRQEKKIQIDKIEICIITTYKAYEEYINRNLKTKEKKYNNFETMKNYCHQNDFVFLIYDINNSEFFIFNKDNILTKTNLESVVFPNELKNIFENDDDIKGIKKLNYYFKLKSPNVIGKIKLNNNMGIEKLNAYFYFKIIKNNIIFYSNKNIIKKDNITDFDFEDNIYDDEYDKNESNEEEFLEEDEVINKNKENYNNDIPEIVKNLFNEGIDNEIEENKIYNQEEKEKEKKVISKKRRNSINQFEDDNIKKNKEN